MARLWGAVFALLLVIGCFSCVTCSGSNKWIDNLGNPAGLMICWAVVNMIFLRGAPPPFSLTWQYDEAKKSVNSVDQEISGSMASLWQILQIPGLLQYAFSDLLV